MEADNYVRKIRYEENIGILWFSSNSNSKWKMWKKAAKKDASYLVKIGNAILWHENVCDYYLDTAPSLLFE